MSGIEYALNNYNNDEQMILSQVAFCLKAADYFEECHVQSSGYPDSYKELVAGLLIPSLCDAAGMAGDVLRSLKHGDNDDCPEWKIDQLKEVVCRRCEKEFIGIHLFCNNAGELGDIIREGVFSDLRKICEANSDLVASFKKYGAKVISSYVQDPKDFRVDFDSDNFLQNVDPSLIEGYREFYREIGRADINRSQDIGGMYPSNLMDGP